MAVFTFSALSDGQAIAFDPSADLLQFDQAVISAADLRVVAEGADARVTVIAGAHAGKDVLLLDVAPRQLAFANVQFANGSRLLFGDNAVAQNDDAANAISGTAGRDLLQGFGGNDFMQGGAGNDALLGGAGGDTLGGNDGNDWLEGGAGADTLAGGGGQDTVMFRDMGAAHADTLTDFASGWDALRLDGAVFTALGAAGRLSAGDARFWAAAGASGGHDADDRLVFNTTTRQLFYDADGSGAGVAQLIATFNGNLAATDITVEAGSVPPPLDGERIEGTSGNDFLAGGAGHDTLLGFNGDDTLDGGPGNDLLEGGAGRDDYFVTQGDTIVETAANDGNDGVHSDGSWTLGADLENLFLLGTGAWEGTGNALDNLILGNDAANILRGGTGADRLFGQGGDDVLMLAPGETGFFETAAGGEGFDLLDFTGQLQSGIVVDLAGGEAIGGGAGGAGRVLLGEIEAIVAGEFADALTGDDAANRLDGAGGNDTLDGGAGADTLVGGAGADLLVFTQPPGAAHADRVAGFTSGSDRIELKMSVSGLGAQGAFAAGDARFHAAAGASGGHDADDRIVYNTSTGELFYDADGSGAGAAQLLAVLEGAPALQATDFFNSAQVVQGGDGDDSLTGTDNPDSLHGGPGDDTLVGGEGADTLDGGEGNDSLVGAEGADLLSGGAGNDVLDGDNSRTFDFDLEAETLDGGLGDDTFIADNAGDTLLDAGGMDLVVAENIDWTLGEGFENLVLRNANDFRTVGIGNDLDNVLGEAGRGWFAVYEGRGGDDTIFGTVQDDTLRGDDGDDLLDGDWDYDVLEGGAGNDTLNGGFDDHGDTLTGGAGADVFVVGHGFQGSMLADVITDFSSGSDRILLDGNDFPGIGPSGAFAPGDERFYAAAGATSGHDATDRVIFDTATGDVYYDEDGSGSGAARLIAHLPALAADDIVVVNGSAEPPPSVITGTEGDDFLEGTEADDTLDGLGGNDDLWGGAGNDLVLGGAGDDDFSLFEFQSPGIRGHGDDTLDGGSGRDGLFVDQTSALVVDLQAGTLAGGVPGSASLAGIEDFFVWHADVFDDSIRGSAADNYLTGGAGSDTVEGGAGSDWLHGGLGADRLAGGAGADNFRFMESPGAANADVITDFASALDTIYLDGHLHDGIGGFGRFAAGDARFYAAAGASAGHDASDRVVYDTASGNLWYDADGSGAGAAQLIATLQPGAALAASDLFVENPVAPFVFQGGPENNNVFGDELGDTLRGGGGNDTLRGEGGDDLLEGEAGDDSLDGGEGIDTLNGGTGDDAYVVTAGDLLSDAGGSDTVMTGTNWFLGAQFEHAVMTGAGNVQVNGNNLGNLIVGNGGDNYFNARAGNDTLHGHEGNDTFDMSTGGTASWGTDYIDGGSGIDQVDFAGYARSGVVADLGAGTVTGGGQGGAGSATLVGIERFIGDSFNDWIRGSGEANYLDGRGGNDTLAGGAGADTLIGSGGSDRFVFDAAPGAADADVVAGFSGGADRVLLDDAAMAALGAVGRFASADARFHAAAGASGGHDADDRVVYNSSSGQLYYDADGSGAGAAQLIATLQGVTALAASDFEVI